MSSLCSLAGLLKELNTFHPGQTEVKYIEMYLNTNITVLDPMSDWPRQTCSLDCHHHNYTEKHSAQSRLWLMCILFVYILISTTVYSQISVYTAELGQSRFKKMNQEFSNEGPLCWPVVTTPLHTGSLCLLIYLVVIKLKISEIWIRMYKQKILIVTRAKVQDL